MEMERIKGIQCQNPNISYHGGEGVKSVTKEVNALLESCREGEVLKA
jgi:hypothetical protein